jgi:arylsulfatase A-like enzyme
MERFFFSVFGFLLLAKVLTARPNILVILADDLGYGDTSVAPFSGHGILTPELEKMAKEGAVMTNFHSAAPVCTPARASIMSGLFPWRLGIYSVFGSGPQANDHLSVTMNAPIIFQQAGYHTAHVGKWHLGGLRPMDVSAREGAPYNYTNINRGCAQTENNRGLLRGQQSSTTHTAARVPGPLQHGFNEYIAMHEGAGSHRLQAMIPKSTLYRTGAEHLLRNDLPYHKTKVTHTIPYYTILYYTILHYTIPYYTILYHTII